MKKAILLLTLLVFVLNVAGEDLRIRGVTITIIDKAVFKFAPVSGNNDPSCVYYMNETDRDGLLDRLTSEGLNVSRRGGLCNYGILIKVNDVNYTFDSNWLIADKKIFNETNWITAKEAAPIIHQEVDSMIQRSFDTFKTENLGSYQGNRMVLIHIKEIQPTNITTNEEYKKDLAGILNNHPKEIQISEADWPGNYFFAVRADEEIRIQDFGELILIFNESYPMYHNSEFNYAFQSVNYHETNWQKIGELNYILARVEPLKERIAEMRLELITKTESGESGQRKSNYQDRLDYLATNRTELLITYEQEYESLNSELGPIKLYYQNEMNFFYRLGQNHPAASLYAKEVNAQLDVMSSRTSDVEAGLAKIDSIQDSIRNIYYGELGAAVSERAIFESWSMTNLAVQNSHQDNMAAVWISIAAFLISVLGIVLSSYDRFKNDKNYHIFSRILTTSLLLLIVGVLGFGFKMVDSSQSLMFYLILLLFSIIGIATIWFKPLDDFFRGKIKISNTQNKTPKKSKKNAKNSSERASLRTLNR